MSKDAWSLGKAVMVLKDKAVGPTMSFCDSKGEINFSRMNPPSISTEISRQLEFARQSPYLSPLHIQQYPDDDNTFDAKWRVKHLEEAKSIVDQIRLNLKIPKLSGIKQDDMHWAAGILAECLVGRGDRDIDDGVKFAEKEARFDDLTTWLAAALGHKQSRQKIEEEQARQEQEYLDSGTVT